MLLRTLGASTLGNMLTLKVVMIAGKEHNNVDHMDKKC